MRNEKQLHSALDALVRKLNDNRLKLSVVSSNIVSAAIWYVVPLIFTWSLGLTASLAAKVALAPMIFVFSVQLFGTYVLYAGAYHAAEAWKSRDRTSEVD